VGSTPTLSIMNIDLSKAKSSCAKCGKHYGLQRHHKGCEKMWLRHFAYRKGSKTFDEFEKRYWAFLPHDVVLLCDECHLKIHAIYFRIICRWATKHGKLSRWSWVKAHQLMNALQNRCNLWIAGKPIRHVSKLHRVKTRTK
jgi:hypothetical protein